MTNKQREWIGVDLDGSLAYFDRWRGVGHIGPPIVGMQLKVKRWMSEGKRIKIFTARLCNKGATPYIRAWCKEHLGRVLPITNKKDRFMIELYDDRAFHVVHNTGRVIRP